MIQVVIIFALLLANGVLALAEIAIVSARRARLKQFADEGSAGARAALDLANEPSQFLSTVQIGITLVGILAGAFGGATLSASLAALLAQISILAPYAEQLAFIVIVVIITYFSLVIGELVPKRLALTNPERFAIWIAAPMRVLSQITAPLVRFLSFSTEKVLRVLNVPLTNEQTVTEEEVKHMIDEGTVRGVFEASERDIVSRVFRLGDLDVNALMTPRREITALDIYDTEETLRRKLMQFNHSRLPVIDGRIDNLLGIVKTKDLLAQYLDGKAIDLRAVMQPALFVPEGMGALDLLEKFKAERTHIALVTDEYGSIQGIITINDLAEAIVGDVPLTDEAHLEEMVQRGDGSWLVDGRVPIHEFKEKFAIKMLPAEEDGYYQTVGGFVMAMLGHIPRASETFQWNDWRVEVMDMDGRRVDKVLLTREPPSAART